MNKNKPKVEMLGTDPFTAPQGIRAFVQRTIQIADRGRERPRVLGRVRRQTTMPLAWIATRLRMGNAGYVKWLLLQAKKGEICQ
jgi:hypothetical protein